MLNVENLHVRLEEEDKAILKGVTLSVGAGEVPGGHHLPVNGHRHPGCPR